MSDDCIFCKIIAGTLPSTKIFENDDVLVFMDIGPVSKGHALVIPKEHSDPITGTPDEVLHKLIVIAKKIAAAQYAGLGCDGVNVTQANGAAAGQMVEHIHFHIIPRTHNDGKPKNWVPLSYESPEEMEEYAEKIRNSLL